MEHIPKEISQTEIEVQLDSTHDFALPKNNLSESQNNAEVYNPDQVPPDFTAAENHGKAFRIHKSKTIQCHKNLSKICQCCKLSSDAEQLPLSCDLNSFYSVGTYYLGGGYALYFTFLKYCVVLLCLLFSISGLYNLITNISGDDCDESDDSSSFCVKDFLTVITIVNKRSNSKQLTTNLALNLASAVVITVFMHIFRYKMRKISASVYQKNTTPSDYTLKLTRIPTEVSDAEIKNWLESFSTENFPIKCEKIIRTYNLEEIRRIELKKEALKQKYQNVKGTTLQAFFQMELLKLQTEINKKLRNNNYEYTHSVYAVFSDAVVASVLLRMLKPADPSCLQRLNPFHKALLNMGQHKINIKRAPEPTDVWWKNLGHDNKGKRRSRMVTTFSTSLTLAVGFGLILLVYWIQKELREKFTGHTDVTRILGFIGSLLICLINIVLAATIKRFVKYEKHGTRGGFLTAVAEKQTIALLINTAFISLIVEIILSESYTVSNGILTNVYKLDLYRKGGLIENMFFVFLINSFYVPVLDLLNPMHFWKRYKQKKASEMGDSIVMTQQTANTLFEGPQLEISNKYALVIKTMILTSFYAPGMPLVTFISLVGLIFSYWSEKYLFLRRNALPPTLSDWLNNSMIEYLNWAVVAFALGNIMFMATLINTDGELAFSSNDKIIAFVTLGIAAVNILLPMKTLNVNLFRINLCEKKSVESYQEARQYFHTDYDLENPMTRHKALDTLIRKIHKNRSKRSLSKLDPDLKLKIENSIMSNYLCKTDFFQGSKETARSERSARRGE